MQVKTHTLISKNQFIQLVYSKSTWEAEYIAQKAEFCLEYERHVYHPSTQGAETRGSTT